MGVPQPYPVSEALLDCPPVPQRPSPPVHQVLRVLPWDTLETAPDLEDTPHQEAPLQERFPECHPVLLAPPSATQETCQVAPAQGDMLPQVHPPLPPLPGSPPAPQPPLPPVLPLVMQEPALVAQLHFRVLGMHLPAPVPPSGCPPEPDLRAQPDSPVHGVLRVPQE